MNPEFIERRLSRVDERFIGEQQSLRTAVLVPLVRTNRDDWRVYFQERARELDTQPGEVCFPGGMVEKKDSTLRDAAVRETHEEMGVPADSVDVLGSLPPLIMPWRLVVYPFVGVLTEPGTISTRSVEVERIFHFSLETLRQSEPEIHRLPFRPDPPEEFPFEKIPGGRNYDWGNARVPEPFYELAGETVWGITARILKFFLETLDSDE